MGITGAAVRRQAGGQAEGEQALAIFDERKTEFRLVKFPRRRLRGIDILRLPLTGSADTFEHTSSQSPPLSVRVEKSHVHFGPIARRIKVRLFKLIVRRALRSYRAPVFDGQFHRRRAHFDLFHRDGSITVIVDIHNPTTRSGIRVIFPFPLDRGRHEAGLSIRVAVSVGLTSLLLRDAESLE